MNTKYLMIASAATMGLVGIALSFFPLEILNHVAGSSGLHYTILLQITGALFLGFAMMNWMAKTVLIGGIYARPLAMGNFMHFVVGCLALIKVALNNSGSLYIWIVTMLYFVFAALFGKVAFTAPAKQI
ncbi:MAG: hypothetical protein ABI691_19345 [Ginsengibacter sp.]